MGRKDLFSCICFYREIQAFWGITNIEKEKKMKKLSLAITIILLLFGSIGPFAAGQAAAESQTELPIGTKASGEISDENSEKVYKIDLSKAGTLTVDISSYFEHMDVQLHNLDGEEIWDSNVYDGEENNPKKWSDQVNLEAGEYFLSIKQGSWGENTGSYSVETDFKSAENNEIESNNGTEIAQELTLNEQTVQGFLSWSDSVDYYKVQLPKAGKLTVNISSYFEHMDVQLHDLDGEEIWNSNVYDGEEYNPQKLSNHVHLEAGTYYIKISKGSWGNTTGTYQLDTLFQAAENNEVEPNNGTEIAQLLTLNEKPVQGFLSWSDSEDYYKVVLPKAGQLKINISTYFEHMDIQLLDTSREELLDTSALDGKENDPQKWTNEMDLEAGTYYIKISKGSWGGTTGTYLLNVEDLSTKKSFADVSGHYKEAVDYLVQADITQGLSNTKFGTHDKIKRVDAAVLIAKALKLDLNSTKNAGFKDVPQRATSAVNALVEKGIVNGKSKDKFGSDDNLTRGEMALMLARAYELDGTGVNLPYKDVSERYESAVKALLKAKVTQGKSATSFGTTDSITRGEMAIFLYRANGLN
jgi:predicted transposase YbfD/YdcC